MKKLIKTLLSMSLLCTSLISNVHVTHAQDEIFCTQLTGSNIDAHNYQNKNYVYWSNPAQTFLEKTSNGWMRVISDESVDGYLVDYFDSNFNETKRIVVPMELDIFGGFYASEDAYFIVSGQTNTDEDNTKEVVRVSKYDKDWNLLDFTSISNINTTVPFDAGSVRMDDNGTYLVIRTAHEMYKSDDGKNHQSNMTFQINMSDMTLTDSFTKVMNNSYGYVSHSFNQFIKMDETSLVALDHGDSHPRSFVMFKYNTDFTDGKFTKSSKETIDNVNVLSFAGANGANQTGASAGGLEISDTHYLMVASSVPQDENFDSYKTANVLVGAVNKSTLEYEVMFKTAFAEGEATVSTPQLVKVNDNRFVVMYEVNQKVNYIVIDGTGKTIQEAKTITCSLSDCHPIVDNNKVTWYTYNKNETIFYQLDLGTNICTQKPLNTGHVHGNVGEVVDGFAEVECNKCHKTETINCITNFILYWGNAPTGSFSSKVNTELEIGSKIYNARVLTYASTANSFIKDELVVTLDDPTVLEYEFNGSTGCFTALKDGICKVTFASKYNPSVKKEITFNVGNTEVEITVPERVTDLKAQLNGEKLSLSWSAPENASSFEVYMKTKNGTKYSFLGEVAAVRINVSSLTKGQTYNFYVVAKNEKGSSEPSNVVEVTIPEPQPEVDKTALNSAISETNTLKEADYTVESWSNFVEALDDAKDVAANETATQEEVDSAVASLKAALKALVDKPVVNKDALVDAVADAEALDANEYTEETWSALSKVLTAARLVVANETATQEEVDSAVASLEAALKALATKPVEPEQPEEVDKTRLYELIEEVDYFNKDSITEDSWANLMEAMSYAQIVASDSNASQDEVDLAIDKLEEAIDNLRNIPESPAVSFPKKVENLTAREEAGTVILTWDDAQEVANYTVYVMDKTVNKLEYKTTTNKSSFKVLGLRPDRMYAFYVVANNAAGTSEPCEEVTATITPSIPKNLKIVQNNYKDVTLTWDAITGVSSYEVYCKSYNDSSKFVLVGTVEGTSYKSTSLKTGKTYTFYVVAKGTYKSSEVSEQVSIATKLEGKPKLSVEQVSRTKLKLNWTSIEGATRYIIYCKRNSDSYKKVLTLSSKILEYTTTELPKGNYTYVVKAARYDSSDRVMTAGSNAVVGTSTYTKPVITLKAGTKQIKVTWDRIEGVTYYEVYRATSKTGTYKKIKTTNQTSFTQKSLTSGKTYYYKVRGYKTYSKDKNTKEKIYTSFSAVKYAKAK